MFFNTKSKVCTIFLLISTTFSASSSSSPQPLESLKEFVDNLVTTEFLPVSQATGLAVTISRADGTILYSNGFGFRDLEANSSFLPSTLTPIGSIGKGFTAVVVVKYLSENFPQYGESVVEMPIMELSPSINLTLIDRYRTETISFRDLLSHRTCVSSHTAGNIFGAVNDRAEYIYRTRYESELCPFRSSNPVSSNSMITLAGNLIAQLSGKSYEDLTREFLDEIGMTNSRFMDYQEDLDLVPNLAQGYYPDLDNNGRLTRANTTLLKQLAVTNADGGLLSTPDDMAKYISFHLNNGRVGDKQVVPESVMEWLSKTAISTGSNTGYGMGVGLEFVPGERPLMTHDCFWAPYVGRMSIFHALDVGLFTTSNGPGMLSPLRAHVEIHAKILQFLAQETPKASAMTRAAVPLFSFKIGDNFPINHRLENQKGVHVDSPQKFELTAKNDAPKPKLVCSEDAIVGVYGNGFDGTFEVYYDDANLLKITYGKFGHGTVSQIGDCKFQIKWTSDILVHLYTWADGQGSINTMEFQQDLDTLVWDFVEYYTLVYQRDLTVDKFPVVPWQPDSCRPQNFYP